MKRRVCVVITARASYAKFKTVLSALQKNSSITLQIVVAGSAVLERFGLVEEQIRNDGFNVDERIFLQIEGASLSVSAKSTGLGIIEFSSAFERLDPNVVVVMADRYEVIAPAVAAAYQNIPLAHIQGGEVSGNIDEKVRHAITKLADVHFPATSLSKKRILKLGECPEGIHLTGCPSIDIAKKELQSKRGLIDVYGKYGGVGSRPKLQDGFILALQHPVTTSTDSASDQITQTLSAAEAYGKPILWFWPNADPGNDHISKKICGLREEGKLRNIHFLKNIEPSDFLNLMKHCGGILGNSSAAIREGSFLGTPAINIGDRQNNRERGENVLDVGYDCQEILSSMQHHFFTEPRPSALYGNGNAGKMISDRLATITFSIKKSFTFN